MIDKPKYGMRKKSGLVKQRGHIRDDLKNSKASINRWLVDNDKKRTIYLDLSDAMNSQAVGGLRYDFTMVTAQYGLVRARVLKARDKAMECVFHVVQWFDRKLKYLVRWVHADNAREFLVMRKRLRNGGREFTSSSACKPDSNGLVERNNRAILHKGRALLGHACLKGKRWREAVLQATALQSVTVTNVLRGSAPHDFFWLSPVKQENPKLFDVVHMCTLKTK